MAGRESDFTCAKQLIFGFQLAINGIVSIFGVADNRATNTCEMRANLMGAPGVQL